jgi:hypothetical protein
MKLRLELNTDCMASVAQSLVRDGPLDIWWGGGGQIPKKNSRTEKIQRKKSCTTNLLKNKIEQELRMIFKIVMHLL